MAKFAGYTVFFCTILLGYLYGSYLFLLTTDNWYIRDAVFYQDEDKNEDGDYDNINRLSNVEGFQGNTNTFLRDSITLLIATSLAAVVYAFMSQQIETMKKWLIALCFFATCSIICCIFADRAGPEGIVINNQYYRWKDVAYVELYLLPIEDDDTDWDRKWISWNKIPNGYFQYKLVMNNGASINVFNWFQLSRLVELDRHVRQLGIKVVNGNPITDNRIRTLQEPLQSEGLVRIEQGNKTIKVIYKKRNTQMYEHVYQEVKISADYRKRYTAVFTGEDWYNTALTQEQRQMLKSIFTR